jgi:hypothetical protein
MITDIFAKRYEDLEFNQQAAENVISPTVVQASYIFFEDVQPKLKFPDEFFRALICCSLKRARAALAQPVRRARG